MPTMKLFSLLMGSSGPEETPPDTPSAASAMAEAPEEPVQGIVPPSPHLSINFDRLRRIFQTLSSSPDKSPDPENDDEPWRMRQKFLRIFDRKIKPEGFSKSHPVSLKIPRDKFLALIRRRQHTNGDTPRKLGKRRRWAKEHLNRISNSLRHVKSDSFIPRHFAKHRNANDMSSQTEIEEHTELRVPSMKRKSRHSVEQSRKIISSVSRTAHLDTMQQLQHSSKEHCLDEIDFRRYKFPFENLVFEGGGAKVHTYIGAIKCMEEAGIRPKRLAGTSAGAITAGLLAVGYTSEEIHILYEYDVEYFVKDGSCGLLSLLPNMFRHYGWHPGERATKWFGECLAVKTGNPDITFQQIYDEYGVELCIVAVNLTNRCEEYFHPKTAPDMPVKTAVRMSSSIPGLIQPVKSGNNLYIDGGVLCNYPVHAFDGWWLSMTPEDAFYKKMGSFENLPQIMERKNRFGSFNEKTLGFCMFSMFDDKALRHELEKRHKLKVTKRPNTKLYAKRVKLMKARDKKETARDIKLDSLSRFFKVLRKVHEDDRLDKARLIKEFNKQYQMSAPSSPEHKLADPDKSTTQTPPTTGGLEAEKSSIPGKPQTPPETVLFLAEHAKVLFGDNVDFLSLIEGIDCDAHGSVSSLDLIVFLKHQSVDIQSILGDQILGKQQVSNFGSFFMSVQESLMNSARRVYIQSDDLNRTVGINTDYIKMDDFNLDIADQEFLIKQGYVGTATFLRYWIHQHCLPPSRLPRTRGASRSEPCSEDESIVESFSDDSPHTDPTEFSSEGENFNSEPSSEPSPLRDVLPKSRDSRPNLSIGSSPLSSIEVSVDVERNPDCGYAGGTDLEEELMVAEVSTEELLTETLTSKSFHQLNIALRNSTDLSTTNTETTDRPNISAKNGSDLPMPGFTHMSNPQNHVHENSDQEYNLNGVRNSNLNDLDTLSTLSTSEASLYLDSLEHLD